MEAEEEMKALIKDIISFVEEIPEPYKLKCFEILLTISLQKGLSVASVIPSIKPEVVIPAPSKFIIPIDVRAFFQQHNVPEESLYKLFFIEKNEVRHIYKVASIKKAAAQIQLTLLIALENALTSGKFEFSVEMVRARCIENKCYDRRNFSTIFKTNSRFFKDLSDEEHVELSPDGKAELAEIIPEIIK